MIVRRPFESTQTSKRRPRRRRDAVSNFRSSPANLNSFNGLDCPRGILRITSTSEFGAVKNSRRNREDCLPEGFCAVSSTCTEHLTVLS